MTWGRLRKGVTLLEIMVVMAILATVMALAIPAVSNTLSLQQTGFANELANTYRFLRDEAAMRNVTFRIVYDLDKQTYTIEAGDPNTLIFTNPEDLQDYEEDLADKMGAYTERELEELSPEDEELQDLMDKRFSGLEDDALNTTVDVPGGSVISWVYTPQYGEDGIEMERDLRDLDAEELESALADIDDDDRNVAYSYIFPNGFVEHTVVRIHDDDDPSDGITIEVEPLSGRVLTHDDLIDPEDSLDWIPDEGPDVDF
ncbi:MAG: prepilin-type N-terminal cleavage/methylation domain-containing protein [Proteobacteria bacterium]|nr:prepilin-type N-terminal cleavage/methylation domain-containing protein [Pseudomonadota bacterium]MCP4916477.1 prepilin-type N-terminal cleavage/methylation domain-containing protein [Pseudomonadota bacterium]